MAAVSDELSCCRTCTLEHLCCNGHCGVDWVADDGHPGIRAMARDTLCQGGHDAGIDIEQVIPSHAWLPWDACGRERHEDGGVLSVCRKTKVHGGACSMLTKGAYAATCCGLGRSDVCCC